MHVAYVGTEFRGLQLSRDYPAETTVEGVLELALLRAGLIAASNYGELRKIRWSRSSRTDKGVHSLATVIGCRVVTDQPDEQFALDPEGQGLAARINAHLPPSVRVLSCQRVNKKFIARRACEQRGYTYFLPAHVLGLAPLDAATGDGACVLSAQDEDKLRLFREVLRLFEGRHPFHNYTVQRQQYALPVATPLTRQHSDEEEAGSSSAGGPARQQRPAQATAVADDDGGSSDDEEDASTASTDGDAEGGSGSQQQQSPPPAGGMRVWRQLCGWQQGEVPPAERLGAKMYRQVESFTADAPARLCPGGVPCVRVRVTGESFMLNQIRHMIGAAVAVANGFLSAELVRASLTAPARLSVPKAPPHTLILSACKFTPFRGVGGEEAAVARFSGAALELRSQGQEAQAAFLREVLGPQLNQLLLHPSWAHFTESLAFHHWDERAAQELVEAHAAWLLKRSSSASPPPPPPPDAHEVHAPS